MKKLESLFDESAKKTDRPVKGVYGLLNESYHFAKNFCKDIFEDSKLRILTKVAHSYLTRNQSD